MTSKKKTESRRAKPFREIDRAKSFDQDWERLNKAGRIDMSRVKEVMALIAINDGPLGAEWKDHVLKGREWGGCRECHVGGDLLLIYEVRGDESVIFVRLGSHSELFG